MQDLKEVWVKILTEILPSISRPFFITYFKDTAILNLNEEGSLVIGVPRPMFFNWHLEHTQDKIYEIAKKIFPNLKNVVFQIEGSLEGDSQRTVDLIKIFPDKNKARKLPKKQEVKLAYGIKSKILNPKYSLNNFVIGSNNQLAHAASSAVSSSPGKKYNPLFIYGEVGLGKTHLLQGIGNEILKNNKEALVVYVTSETFTNEVIEAMKKHNMDKFRKQYREADILIIDDVQFFAGKDRTQEEFFHTFNTLHEAGKQVIISSDRPPKELNGIEDRIKSRCEWGMTVDVKMPEYETRLAILYDKAQNYQALIPAEVFEFIAFNVHHSIRELEGILMQVVAILELKKQTPTVSEVAEIIKKLNKDVVLQGFTEKKEVLVKDIETISEYVADYYNVTVSEILGNKRTRDIVLPRQITMYFAKNLLNLPLKKIGDYFGGKDHTSVLHSLRKIEKDLKKDQILRKDLKELKSSFGIK
jgi:chromosomal replication initiator protein